MPGLERTKRRHPHQQGGHRIEKRPVEVGVQEIEGGQVFEEGFVIADYEFAVLMLVGFVPGHSVVGV